MKICIPIEKEEGMSTKVYGHFGSAPLFAVYNTEAKSLEILNNGNLHHAHGQCSPIAALSGTPVDILVTGGIGAGAIVKLRAMGIKVCRVNAGQTIQDVIAGFEQNTLTEIQDNHACNQHSCS
jgi:predicted Fe-Mo cluster-binding NifX family protein